MYLIFLIALLLFSAGVLERIRHQKNVDAVPIRVNINGVRGKSTATRLITGILKEQGHHVIGKTTGTDARMLFWDTTEEMPIRRRPEGPNINEQLRVLKEVEKRGANALVSECMAVTPDYQITFQKEMLQANIAVIVNVLEDHMELLGPTLDEVAESFTSCIPYKGKLIVSEGPYVEFFKKEAARRKTDVIVADNSRISEDFLKQFSYMVFPENASLALAVAEALGIDEETAKRGMLNAQPDPGALRILPLGSKEKPSYFVNGFAGNDAASTLNMWARVKELGYPADNPIIVMNCREDRVDRTEQFAEDVMPYFPSHTLVLIGETTSPIVRNVKAGNVDAAELLDLEDKGIAGIESLIDGSLENRIIYGVGNIHGAAEKFLVYMDELHNAHGE